MEDSRTAKVLFLSSNPQIFLNILMCHHILDLFSSACLWLMQKSQENYRLQKDSSCEGWGILCGVFLFKKDIYFWPGFRHLFESWTSLFALNCQLRWVTKDFNCQIWLFFKKSHGLSKYFSRCFSSSCCDSKFQAECHCCTVFQLLSLCCSIFFLPLHDPSANTAAVG